MEHVKKLLMKYRHSDHIIHRKLHSPLILKIFTYSNCDRRVDGALKLQEGRKSTALLESGIIQSMTCLA